MRKVDFKAIISPLQGLGNSIVYGFSKKLRLEYAALLKPKIEKPRTPNERDPLVRIVSEVSEQGEL